MEARKVEKSFRADRVAEIFSFYTTTDLKYTHDFLAKYDVRYIIVGQLEAIYYPGEGLTKFKEYDGTLWKEVYRDVTGQTVIYKVLP